MFSKCCVEPAPSTCSGDCNRVTGIGYRAKGEAEMLVTIPEEFDKLEYLEELNLADRNLLVKGSNLRPRNETIFDLAVGPFGFANFDRLRSIRIDTSQLNGNMEGTIYHASSHSRVPILV